MLLATPACTLTGPWALIRRRRPSGAMPWKSRTKRSPSRTMPDGCGAATPGSSRRMASVLKSTGRRIHVLERLLQLEAHRIVIFLLNKTLHHAHHIVVAVGHQQVDHQQAHGNVVVGQEHAPQSLADFGIAGVRLKALEGLKPLAGDSE